MIKQFLSAVFFVGVGVAGGYIAGLLTAPHKGSITRAKLKTKMDEHKETGLEKANEWKSRARSLKKQKLERLHN